MNDLLEAIPNYDIVLDRHNSPMCKNLMLCSSPKEEHHQGLVPLYLKKRIQEEEAKDDEDPDEVLKMLNSL